MDTLGKRIGHAITASGVSVEDVARACGVTVQSIYGWIRDSVKDLRNENLFALADRTGFEARWIATGKGPQQPQGDPRKQALDQIFAKLDERGKTAVLRVAESESSYVLSDIDISRNAA